MMLLACLASTTLELRLYSGVIRCPRVLRCSWVELLGGSVSRGCPFSVNSHLHRRACLAYACGMRKLVIIMLFLAGRHGIALGIERMMLTFFR